MKRSGSGVHVFELVVEHLEDILITDFSYVWRLHARTYNNHIDRHVWAVAKGHLFRGDQIQIQI